MSPVDDAPQEPSESASSTSAPSTSESSGSPTQADPVPAEEDLSPRHVRAAARVLSKEARKILKKHGARLGAQPAQAVRGCVEAIADLTGGGDIGALEVQAKRLDELLHRHASFARKSAFRETAENIAVAVMIALGLRSCLYEPFKIPSASMMPTLRTGDHIFVNKFVYGVQIPFTNTVVGESIGEIEHGDVIVFRFPLNEEEDFIKRVMGLPGDEVRVLGRQVSVKRAGEPAFEVLPHERLQQRCLDEASPKQIANCTLYLETAGDKTYTVRYELTADERSDLSAGKPKVWKVPQGHVLVMGDNRNKSHDSLRWMVTVDAIRAERLVTAKDLRDLTTERLFELQGRSVDHFDGTSTDPHYDKATYTANHRSVEHDLSLRVWREPTLSADAVFRTRVLHAGAQGTEPTTLAALATGAAGADDPVSPEDLAKLSPKIRALVVAPSEHAKTVIVALSGPDAVVEFSCGHGRCDSDGALARRVVEVLLQFVGDPEQEARLMLQPDREATYSKHWSGRHNPNDHYWERRFAKGGGDAGPRAQVRLRAFRSPEEGLESVRDAALHDALHSPMVAPADTPAREQRALEALGPDAWLIESTDAFTFVAAEHSRPFVVVLGCGKAVCSTVAKAENLARTVYGRIPAASADRRRMVDLLGPKDLGGVPEIPVAIPERAEYDDVELQASVKDEAHSLVVETWMTPKAGIAAKVAAVRDTVGGLQPDPSVADGGYYGAVVPGNPEASGHTFVFGVAQTDVVLRMTCNAGLCPDKDTALALAQRAATTALDTSTFIDKDADRPKPFVPRGNIKGRADRIWLPTSRFWLPIR